jgi:ABC-2 type transport system ATP-binding protein
LGHAPPVQMVDVSKHYQGGRGIDHVDLEVLPGEVFAFLGPNGAGKTTTIRLLLDLIRPSSGRVTLFGLDPRRDGVAIRHQVGYLPGELGLYERLTARELLTHFAHLRGGPPWREIGDLAQRFDLDVDRPIRALSKGNRQKVGLVQALMGNPRLLVLDEPTSGLDPLVQNEVLDQIRGGAARGQAVFLSSHVLSEVARVADRVGIIGQGRMISTQRVEDLRSKAVHYFTIRFQGRKRPTQLASLPGVRALPSLDDAVRLEVSGSLSPVVRVLSRYPLEDLEVREPDLEEVFLGIFGAQPVNHASTRAGDVAL